jgi:hypothetical protein
MSREKRRSRTSYCGWHAQGGTYILRGTPEQLVHRYESLAAQARNEKDNMNEQMYLQYADHWRRVATHEVVED